MVDTFEEKRNTLARFYNELLNIDSQVLIDYQKFEFISLLWTLGTVSETSNEQSLLGTD